MGPISKSLGPYFRNNSLVSGTVVGAVYHKYGCSYAPKLSEEFRKDIGDQIQNLKQLLHRKVHAREELFTFIFQNLQQNPQRTYGVGQLFFEVVRGVKEQFHYSLEPAVVNLPSIKDLPQYCMSSVMEVISSVMINDCLNLPVEKMKIVVSQDILPVLLSMCLKMIEIGENTKKNQALEILSESIKTLRPMSESEDDVKSFSKLYLHLNSTAKNFKSEKSVYDILQNFLFEILECDDMEQNLSTINKALVCLPHIRKYSDCINILRMVEYYLNSVSKAPVVEDLPEIILTLIQNLASPFHLTLSVLNICLQVENFPTDFQTCREKLKWLAKLEYQFIEKNLPAAYAEHLTKAAIYFLLGMLYVNFKLLWEPSIKILETFAHGTPELFWSIFYPHLSKSFEFCVKCNSGEEVFKVSESPRENVDIFNHHMLLWKAMEKFSDVVERKNKVVVPLLLQFMVKLVESPESIKEVNNENLESIQSKNENISDVEMKDETENIKEVNNENLESIQSKNENISDVEIKDEAEDAEIDFEDSENESEEEEEDDDSKDELDNSRVLTSKKKKYVRHFQVTRTLAAYLSVFSKFKHPKSNYKADELEKLYKELLTFSDLTIQKLAFDCILTFNYKYLTPYKENFYRILDNKTFKNEIVLFNVDTENHVIAEEHRIGALTILMRLNITQTHAVGLIKYAAFSTPVATMELQIGLFNLTDHHLLAALNMGERLLCKDTFLPNYVLAHPKSKHFPHGDQTRNSLPKEDGGFEQS
ncbi:small subunit processome component 20 homolog [Trichonephila clavipes]|nr:small subunit processome component 20 homolog [Trichonephila clavipes]